MIKCPMCEKLVPDGDFLKGINKCVNCLFLVGSLRRSGKKVSCISIFYGRFWPVELEKE